MLILTSVCEVPTLRVITNLLIVTIMSIMHLYTWKRRKINKITKSSGNSLLALLWKTVTQAQLMRERTSLTYTVLWACDAVCTADESTSLTYTVLWVCDVVWMCVIHMNHYLQGQDCIWRWSVGRVWKGALVKRWSMSCGFENAEESIKVKEDRITLGWQDSKSSALNWVMTYTWSRLPLALLDSHVWILSASRRLLTFQNSLFVCIQLKSWTKILTNWALQDLMWFLLFLQNVQFLNCHSAGPPNPSFMGSFILKFAKDFS